MKRFVVWMLAVSLLLCGVSATAEQTLRCLTEVRMAAEDDSVSAVLEYTADGIFYRCDVPGMQVMQKYSLSGQLLEETYFNEDGSEDYRDVYGYDAAGRLISEQTLYADGTMSNIYTYTYDDAGRLVSEDSVSPAGDVSKREEYIYNEAGELVQQNSYTNYGMHHYYRYSYDAEGRPVRRDEYLAEDGNEYRTGKREEAYEGFWTYTYDASGNLLSYEWNHEAVDKSWRNFSEYYVYDEAGRLVKYQEYGFDLDHEEEYVYDAEGYLMTILMPMDEYSIHLCYEDKAMADDIAEAADCWSRTGFATIWQSHD